MYRDDPFDEIRGHLKIIGRYGSTFAVTRYAMAIMSIGGRL
jgi:hypothetical protein